MPLLGELIDENGWRAGAVLPAALTDQIRPYLARHDSPAVELRADDWLVLVSQTCDIVQRNDANEPFVEVLHCRPITALRSEFQGRKSTRLLDFRPNREDLPEVFLSAHAVADRYTIPRQLLSSHAPDPDRRLSDRTVINVQQWYALRYSRPAWPDAFVRRITSSVKKRLISAIKSLSTDEIEVRVAIAEKDDELADDIPYHIVVFFVVDQIVWDQSPSIRQEANLAFASFVTALNQCKGIEVNPDESSVICGESFSWQLTRTTDEWNFANLSTDG